MSARSQAPPRSRTSSAVEGILTAAAQPGHPQISGSPEQGLEDIGLNYHFVSGSITENQKTMKMRPEVETGMIHRDFGLASSEDT